MGTYIAKLNNVRMSPQKVSLVVDMVRGKNALESLDILKFTNKKAATYVTKAVRSALANAKHNDNASQSNLKIDTIFVTPAVTYKRGKAVSRGRFFKIMKRGSNITVKLTETSN